MAKYEVTVPVDERWLRLVGNMTPRGREITLEIWASQRALKYRPRALAKIVAEAKKIKGAATQEGSVRKPRTNKSGNNPSQKPNVPLAGDRIEDNNP